MAYLTLDELRRVPIPLNKSASGVLREVRGALTGTVFLSHSHLDDYDLAHVVALLEQSKVAVVMDKSETRLQGVVGDRAAPIVKSQIKSCPKLVVALTTNIVGSRWVPWEIGLADGFHGERNIALFPLRATKADDVPVEKEYLSLYPSIEWVSLDSGYEGYCVKNVASGKYWTIKQWLTVVS